MVLKAGIAVMSCVLIVEDEPLLALEPELAITEAFAVTGPCAFKRCETRPACSNLGLGLPVGGPMQGEALRSALDAVRGAHTE